LISKERRGPWLALGLLTAFTAVLFALTISAHAHDIYSGVHGKDGQLCCGADDCFKTTWRERGEAFDFYLPRERTWITIARERITFLPIPADDYAPIDGDAQHYGHICYRPKTAFDSGPNVNNPDQLIGDFRVWCAFIPPGGV
jgi:hypothetical protein